MKNHPTSTIVFGFTLFLLAAGCSRGQIQVYQVPKDESSQPLAENAATPLTDTSATMDPNPPSTPALPPGHPDFGGMAAASDSTAPLTWITPDGWALLPPTEMRVASFKVNRGGKQADVSVVPLGGMAGGDNANVNRWRGQVGLSALSDAELAKSVETVEAGGQPAALFDLAGTNPGSGDVNRIIGVIQHRDDTAWFFKMTGAADLVEQEKPTLLAFLKSVKFSSSTSAQTDLPSTLPPGHPVIGNGAMTDTAAFAPASSAPLSHEGQPNWQVPAAWQEISGGQFLIAKFVLSGDGAARAAVNVSRSAGDGGGLAANVNRWRGQLGLPSATDLSTSSVTVAGGQASLVDLNGTSAQTGQPTRLVGVVVPQGNHTWFYKLMGNPDVVASQKDAFVKFVQGVNY